MRKLYRFFWNCGINGNLEGLFIAEDSDIKKLLGKEIYFGEVLGKHSDIYGELEEQDIIEISNNQDFINKLKEAFNSTSDTLIGYNPIEYIPEEEEEDE